MHGTLYFVILLYAGGRLRGYGSHEEGKGTRSLSKWEMQWVALGRIRMRRLHRR